MDDEDHVDLSDPVADEINDSLVTADDTQFGGLSDTIEAIGTDDQPVIKLVDDAASGSLDGNNNDQVPSPEAVEPQCMFTSEDTIKLHRDAAAASGDADEADAKNSSLIDETSSMFVNADDTMSEMSDTTSSLGLTSKKSNVDTTTNGENGGVENGTEDSTNVEETKDADKIKEPDLTRFVFKLYY